MDGYRIERDMLGEENVPADALWGIHTLRAVANFPIARRPVRRELVHAYGAVKLACAQTNAALGMFEQGAMEAVEQACREMMRSALDEHIIVDALQGGAGTATNMNVNEVLANRALQILGRPLGDYDTLDPLRDLNRHQSTNDTYPTALRVAAIGALHVLESEVVRLQEAFQEKERAFDAVVKVGRTQMQDAVLITLGREMSAYAEAVSRDRWRISKCEERLRVINLGGTAIGTGLTAPRRFIFAAADNLRTLTGLGLARADNLVEATQNTDAFVEVSGMLKACATNLLKISTDLRLLSSGPESGLGEIHLPARQAGSSIMPGKVNPVIPEAASQAAMLVMGNDQVLAHACSMGSLELNAFMPLIAETLLSNIDLLAQACNLLRRHCIEGLEADEERCRRHVETSTATATALVERLGYHAALQTSRAARTEGRGLRDLLIERELLTAEEFDALTAPESVMRLGSPDRSEEPT